jgi:hypothetical protein
MLLQALSFIKFTIAEGMRFELMDDFTHRRFSKPLV